jgi:hypothetical protein
MSEAVWLRAFRETLYEHRNRFTPSKGFHCTGCSWRPELHDGYRDAEGRSIVEQHHVHRAQVMADRAGPEELRSWARALRLFYELRPDMMETFDKIAAHVDDIISEDDESEWRTCPRCIDKWGAMPSEWGDSVDELDAWREHHEKHMKRGAAEWSPIRGS